MGKTFKRKKSSANSGRKNNRNRFVSISFSLLWVVLFGICIYIYNVSNIDNKQGKGKSIITAAVSNKDADKARNRKSRGF